MARNTEETAAAQVGCVLYTAAYGTPFVIIGPGELGMSGQPDEFVEIDKVQQAIRIDKRIAEKWLQL